VKLERENKTDMKTSDGVIVSAAAAACACITWQSTLNDVRCPSVTNDNKLL